ncbi:MAG: threonylcarbamoyl-AMP synthase [Candidatus Taylorbacteria bacterium RIFCSPLOWO2_12_FULL_43_20]|uniref:L-threonylcarbamoyladenylate synthase n=1 Tax=Candidatus Taylorbacteria bacterium RIFCSPLOWO2_12_FULL_43_20 TaxID=1802332 RepID=A0A1G2P2X3_9BACT|nr:MAG: threonylcarbamoyl-AMP synthase [Candidatus Taylorbacteria bacterium RIFCSPHIGHO2_01_FULL_43_120]OHA23579.1 MAG: threonylcarbamoyl-AMP synthase [Candidatus Taylorbacteria bacterium RIFCSPHIGHO2_02_FULL_43_55]OHA28886.1 MAG: threonylcarbamoyl-AMP synthase [Candidatus Taylorbacteria bacterium RIFCSPHIGHO2_12_FULL_42_34]OHA30284.1 MAG: threonylcarbamoyl-AMP synthase [Candidatus Taylorbacteria bacterium RIFCSPLOWO2_01_FULL_43_83]OHA39336.1 MAG: threonylcarbamoyl-AMP synthase [Candidatus Tayl
MTHIYKTNNKEIIELLKSGKTAVVPTDTIYGLVGSALNRQTVERIYEIKDRNSLKPFIILAGSYEILDDFGIVIDKYTRSILDKIWPGKVSVIFHGVSQEFDYLTRGGDSLAIRIPDNSQLRQVITETGPLVAPSANPEGKPPAVNIKEAEIYFGESVDFYVDGGELRGEPSRIIEIENGKIKEIRGRINK